MPVRLFWMSALWCASLLAVAADSRLSPWGPQPGSRIAIDAPDQSGARRTLADLAGDQGLLLFLNRSADW